MARSFRTITVRDLIDLLEGEDPDALVGVRYHSGNRYDRAVVIPLDGDTEMAAVVPSGYGPEGAFEVVDETDEDADEEAASAPVVLVLS